VANVDDVRTIIANRTRIAIQTAAPPLVAPNDILTGDLDKEIDAAVRDYSMDEPRVVLEENAPGALVDVGGIKFYEMTAWDFDVSDPSEVEIEWPIDLARKEILRQGIDLDFTVEERLSAGSRKAFVKFFRVPDSTWRLKYRARFQSIAESPTLANLTARGVFMVGLLAAVYAARVLAAKFGKTNDPTLGVDTVSYRTKAQEWQDIAKTLFDEYQDRLDRPSRIKRAGADLDIVDIDLAIQQSNRFGREYLVHRRRRR
jgi:hypothetical protein